MQDFPNENENDPSVDPVERDPLSDGETAPDAEGAIEEAAAGAPEAQTPPEGENKRGFVAGMFDYLEMFAWSVFAVLVIFTFAVRLCRVDGQSMENTLKDQQSLLLWNMGYTPKQDDIVVFHLTNPDADLEKTLVKRVIATGGQEVVIDFSDGVITVDGEVYADTHSVLKNPYTDAIVGSYTLTAKYNYDSATRVFRATVPEGCIFVMGDNRNNSRDSRDPDVGFVDERCVLGKVILRFSPFTRFD